MDLLIRSGSHNIGRKMRKTQGVTMFANMFWQRLFFNCHRRTKVCGINPSERSISQPGKLTFPQLTWLRASIANFDFNGPAGFPAEIEFWLVTNTRQAKPARGSFDWFALFVSDVRMRLHFVSLFLDFWIFGSQFVRCQVMQIRR